MVEVEFIKTNQEKPAFIHGNYMYRAYTIRSRNIYWVCCKRNCNAKAKSLPIGTQEIFEVELRGNHNHGFDANDILRRRYIFKMKRLMEQSMSSTRSCISTVLQGAPDEVFVALGNPDSIARNLRRFRNKLINPGEIVYESLGIGLQLAKTIRGDRFYQFGPDNKRNIETVVNFCLFFSAGKIELLKEAPVWCVDGTFSVVPSPFYQLFTISVMHNHNVIPVVYALLPNKETATYMEVYRVLQELEGVFVPAVVKTDFEIGSINALMRSFPGIAISGCQFHLGQNLNKKMKELSLWYRYLDCQNVKKFVKSLIALSYVREDLVHETFIELRNHINFPEILAPLYEYFLRTYIGDENINARFPIFMWNQVTDYVEHAIPRTNNAIEGWHRAFASTFGTSNYNLILLISRLVNEEELMHQRIQWFRAGYYPPRRQRYVEIETRVNEFLEETLNRNYGASYAFSMVNRLYY